MGYTFKEKKINKHMVNSTEFYLKACEYCEICLLFICLNVNYYKLFKIWYGSVYEIVKVSHHNTVFRNSASHALKFWP